jgi:hypothetical protein
MCSPHAASSATLLRRLAVLRLPWQRGLGHSAWMCKTYPCGTLLHDMNGLVPASRDISCDMFHVAALPAACHSCRVDMVRVSCCRAAAQCCVACLCCAGSSWRPGRRTTTCGTRRSWRWCTPARCMASCVCTGARRSWNGRATRQARRGCLVKHACLLVAGPWGLAMDCLQTNQ